MRDIPAITPSESHRVRRWDALVLGGALPGLVAAVRIAKQGRRVLVVEEQKATKRFGGLREPFHLGGTGPDHVLGGALRELGIPLIDQRRFAPQPEGLQVVLPDARVDVGPALGMMDELAAWGLAPPDTARAVLRALEQAGARERQALLLAPLVRAGRRLPFAAGRVARGRAASASDGPRGLPPKLESAPEILRTILDALVRALGHHAGSPPSAEARARLLGSALEGSVFVSGGGLRDILSRRLETLHVERRTLPGPVRLVSVAQQPGISPTHTDEIWSGRVMLINAPRQALAAAVDGDPPSLLRAQPATHHRVSLHFRAPRQLLPERMGDRLVCVGDPSRPIEEQLLVCVRSFPGENGAADLVAGAVVSRDADPVEEIERVLRGLLPFSDDWLTHLPDEEPVWDHDRLLADPARGRGWPCEYELRISSRPTVYALDRADVGSLGVEGELLLGWRGGDAIAAGLA